MNHTDSCEWVIDSLLLPRGHVSSWQCGLPVIRMVRTYRVLPPSIIMGAGYLPIWGWVRGVLSGACVSGCLGSGDVCTSDSIVEPRWTVSKPDYIIGGDTPLSLIMTTRG